ncbi:hypothetical protein, partial [Vibrio breoganii]
MLKKLFIKNGFAKGRIIEEHIYELVAEELSRGEKRIGLWTKALALSDGSHSKAESIYIRLRAESIVDEARINEEIRSQRVTEKGPKTTDIQPTTSSSKKIKPPRYQSLSNQEIVFQEVSLLGIDIRRNEIGNDTTDFLVTLYSKNLLSEYDALRIQNLLN